MDISFDITPQDLQKLFWFTSFKKNLDRRLFLIFLFSLWFGAMKEQTVAYDLIYFVKRFVYCFLLLSIINFLISLLIKRNLFSLKGSPLMGIKNIKFRSGGFIIEDEFKILTITWESIEKVYFERQYFYLYGKNKQPYIIPRRAFQSDEDFAAFSKVIANATQRANWEEHAKKIRGAQKWSWIGIIPNFGFLMGVYLVAKGLDYQSRKLKILGVASIIWTFVFWIIIKEYVQK